MVKEEENKIACPVCGKAVGVDVSSCPYCGAEFEEEESAVEAGSAASGADATEEDVACPVCGALVGLDAASCPKCGAEFEEAEIEEVIEVEEKATFEEKRKPAPTAVKIRPSEPSKPRSKGAARSAADQSASVMDARVIGFALVVLGIIGTQIALFVDWYWSWVPPIEDDMLMFVVIPVVILVVGLVAFLVVKKALAGGREMSGMAPGAALSLFLFGILALIVVVLWDPINTELQDSSITVAGGFAIALVVGLVLVIVGSRRASRKASGD